MSEQLTVTAEDRGLTVDILKYLADPGDNMAIDTVMQLVAAHRIKALEQAAGVADGYARRLFQREDDCETIATAIRALKDTSHD